jgi:chromosomal replication initiator protein
MDSYYKRPPKETWEIALGDLQVQVSKANFRTWFSKTVGLSYQDNHFVVGVPNTFAAEYLEKNQRSLIEKALAGLTASGVQVFFQVNGKYHLQSAQKENAAPIPTTPPSFTRLNPDYVFDSFIEGVSNKMARAAAQSVAQNPGHSYNPLFIYGGVGLGKTHLLHAIGQVATANRINVICTSAEQFTNEFVTSVREKNTEDFRNKYRNIGMLLIDDIQFIGGKEQTEESFFHTFNELHNTNRQIVMTSDCPPRAIPLIEERLHSRFEWGLVVDIQPPDYEMRLAILKAKSHQKGINLPSDVLELIAKDAQSNIRILEGSLNRVCAFAKLMKAEPTMDIASRALADIASKEYMPDDITPSSILQAVSECFQLPRDALLGRKRDKDTTLARRLATYLIRQETNCSLAQIGLELGNRDAAYVTNACRKIAGDIDSSPFLRRKVRDIKRNISR